LEQSFWKSFLRAFARAIIVFGLIVLTLAAAPEYQARQGAPYTGFVVAIFYLFMSLRLLIKARFWAVQAGPVERLIPHARGRAYGFFAAVCCQLGITLTMLFAK
jgi:hypothetical protein